MSQSPRPVALIALQAIGAASLLAYPLALMGSFFGALAHRAGTASDWLGWALVALLVSYPVLWCVLWALSWAVLRRGRPGLALALSALPALATVSVPTALWIGGRLDSAADERRDREENARLRAQNPLAADLVAAGLRTSTGPAPSLEETVAKADPALLSRPVKEYGTPLWIALRFSQLERTLDTTRTRPPFLDTARRLIARGARLTPKEETDDPCLPWLVAALASRAPLPDPGAETENPLVWAIANAQTGPPGEGPLIARLAEAERTDPAQLTRETRTYGTPLGMALRRDHRALARLLVGRGAHLSTLERRDAALRARLEPLVRAELDAAGADAYLAGLDATPR